MVPEEVPQRSPATEIIYGIIIGAVGMLVMSYLNN